jgi:hypothetical protein
MMGPEGVAVMETPSEISNARSPVIVAAAAVFWVLVAFALVVVGSMTLGHVLPVVERSFEYIFFPAAAIFLLLGIALIILAAKAPLTRALRVFLIMAGSAGAAFLLSVVLHNLVYGLLIWWFGEDFWGAQGGGDEAFFFIIAIFVCPLVFLVGTVGSIVMFILGRRGSDA